MIGAYRMMKKKDRKRNTVILIVSIILIVIVALFVIFLVVTGDQDKKIGGDRDAHGCLIAAGYSWNNPLGACIRAWELDANKMQAAKIAISPLSYPLTIVEVQTLKCPGCFIVKLQRNDDQGVFQVELNNWTIIWDCKDYPYDNCPERCTVCPPCASCSSLVCQTEEFCMNLGFDRAWYEGIRSRLNSSKQ